MFSLEGIRGVYRRIGAGSPRRYAHARLLPWIEGFVFKIAVGYGQRRPESRFGFHGKPDIVVVKGAVVQAEETEAEPGRVLFHPAFEGIGLPFLAAHGAGVHIVHEGPVLVATLRGLVADEGLGGGLPLGRLGADGYGEAVFLANIGAHVQTLGPDGEFVVQQRGLGGLSRQGSGEGRKEEQEKVVEFHGCFFSEEEAI